MCKRILIPIFLAYIPTSLLAQIFGPTIVFDPTVAAQTAGGNSIARVQRDLRE
jgi:hypothetical protein